MEDGHIQEFFAAKKFDIVRQIFGARYHHGNQHDGFLLPLELINGTDLSIVRKDRWQIIDLHIIWRDHQNIIFSDRAYAAITVGKFLAELHLVNNQKDVLGRFSHGNHIGCGDLSGFISEQIIQLPIKVRASKASCSTCKQISAKAHIVSLIF